jgi:ferredoxin-NADP reductase
MFLSTEPDPRGGARTFSLSSSPTEQGSIAVTTKLTDSPFKRALRALPPGAEVEIFGPLGRFLYDERRPALFLAGGIGITPFRGMIRYAADIGARERIVLLYSARVPEELAFRTEFDAIVRNGGPLVARYTVTRPSESRSGWSGRTGRIDEAWIRGSLGALERAKVYVAGVPQMVRESVDLLRSRFSIRPEDLLYELFGGYR